MSLAALSQLNSRMNTAKLTKFHKEQIHYLQQAIWDLEKAREKIHFAKGNSELGEVYIRDIRGLIEFVQDDIDNIWAEYESE